MIIGAPQSLPTPVLYALECLSSSLVGVLIAVAIAVDLMQTAGLVPNGHHLREDKSISTVIRGEPEQSTCHSNRLEMETFLGLFSCTTIMARDYN